VQRYTAATIASLTGYAYLVEAVYHDLESYCPPPGEERN
jgi:hypothetical protein